MLLREARPLQCRDDGLNGGWEWKRSGRQGMPMCSCENETPTYLCTYLHRPCSPAGLVHVHVVLANCLGVLDHQSHDAPGRAEEGDRLVLGEIHRGAEQVVDEVGGAPDHHLGQADHAFGLLVPRVSVHFRIRGRHGVRPPRAKAGARYAREIDPPRDGAGWIVWPLVVVRAGCAFY